MSCLLRVSKRLKDDRTPDDLAGVQDSVEHECGDGLTADASEKAWNISYFSIFNELQKPILVVSPGLYEMPSRCRDPPLSVCSPGLWYASPTDVYFADGQHCRAHRW